MGRNQIRIDETALFIQEEMHEKVITSGTDVPEQSPSFAIALNEVGITGKTVWVLLPEGRLPFEISATVDLPCHLRGIHMSRLEQVISELHDEPFDRLCDYVRMLTEKVIKRQQGQTGHIVLKGKRPLLRQSKISRQLSVDPLLVQIEAHIKMTHGKKNITITTGIGVCHITACPCTQVYNRDVFSAQGDCPMPTHSQRSQTWLHINCGESPPAYDDLLLCLENSLHLTQDLLKRPDEAEIVMKSHRHPQFAEDAVRESARSVGVQFGPHLPADTVVTIESLSLESIHIHDVSCRLQTTLGEICSLL
ncbi:MAG: GTP cyclohydrolase I FolE2 [Desulfobulbaceae bacterium]|nr:GTP cyclohydrolase I FolE2 [Desulfobulbaceae bacterium]